MSRVPAGLYKNLYNTYMEVLGQVPGKKYTILYRTSCQASLSTSIDRSWPVFQYYPQMESYKIMKERNEKIILTLAS